MPRRSSNSYGSVTSQHSKTNSQHHCEHHCKHVTARPFVNVRSLWTSPGIDLWNRIRQAQDAPPLPGHAFSLYLSSWWDKATQGVRNEVCFPTAQESLCLLMSIGWFPTQNKRFVYGPFTSLCIFEPPVSDVWPKLSKTASYSAGLRPLFLCWQLWQA